MISLFGKAATVVICDDETTVRVDVNPFNVTTVIRMYYNTIVHYSVSDQS